MKHRLFTACVVLMAIPLAGCGSLSSTEVSRSDVDTAELTPVQSSELGETPSPFDPDYQPMAQSSALEQLRIALRATALVRSSAVQDARAASLAAKAQKSARRPRILPTGSAEFNGDTTTSIGISAEQVLWDGGRINARVTEQELRFTDATLRAWAEQNDVVRDGLEAYISLSQETEKLNLSRQLTKDLQQLAALLTSRVEGGVADRGESLKLDIALQEVRREEITARSRQGIAAADIDRVIPSGTKTPAAAQSNALVQMCSRKWPDTEAPIDAIARLKIERAKISEDLTRSRRFPRLVLAAGSAVTNGALSTPGIGLRIDATDMLGPGGKSTIASAQAETEAASVSYMTRRIETRSELEQLQAEYSSLVSEVAELQALAKKNEETLALYHEQVEAGTIAITDGIVLLQEASRTRTQLVEAQASIAVNCIRIGSLRGYLVPIGAIND